MTWRKCAATATAQVLELGAGCGLLGLTLAMNLPDAGQVCLTEQASGSALAHLRCNVEANAGRLPSPAVVTTAACDWTHFTQPELLQTARCLTGSQRGCLQDAKLANSTAVSCTATSHVVLQQQPTQLQAALQPTREELSDMARLLATQWDIVVGSDLVYNSAGVAALPALLASLLEPPIPQLQQQHQERQHQTVFYYAHTKRRFEAADADFLDALAVHGLHCEEVFASEQPPPPPSPPPFSSLFPEMRIAVYRITRIA